MVSLLTHFKGHNRYERHDKFMFTMFTFELLSILLIFQSVCILGRRRRKQPSECGVSLVFYVCCYYFYADVDEEVGKLFNKNNTRDMATN